MGKRGKLFLVLGGLLLILVVSAYVFLSSLPDIAQRVILTQLQSAGVKDARLVVRHIGWESTSLTGIRIGENKDLEIAEIRASYSLPELLRGQLFTITITGLQLRARLDSEGISFGSLDPLLKVSPSNSTVGAPPVPFPNIELRSSKIEVSTPYGPIEVPVSLEVQATETGQVKLEASAEVHHPHAYLRVISTIMREPNGSLQGNLRLFDGRFESDEAGVGTIKGKMTLSGPTLRPSQIKGEIRFSDVRLAQTQIPNARLDFGFKGDQAHASFRAHSFKELSKVQLRARMHKVFGDSPILSVRGEIDTQEGASFQWISPHFRVLKDRGLAHFQLRGNTPPLKRIKDFKTLNLSSSAEMILSDLALPKDRLRIQEAALSLVGNLLFQDDRVMWTPKKGGEIQIKGIRWKEPVVHLKSLRLKIDKTPHPLLEASWKESPQASLTFQTSLTPFPFDVNAAAPRAERIRIQAKLPPLRLSGRISGPAWQPTIGLKLNGGEVNIPRHQIALKGLGAQFRSKPFESGHDISAEFNVRQVLHTRAASFFKPLRFKGNIKGTSNRLRFQSQFTEDNGVMVFDLNGVQNISSGTGNMKIKLHPITFAPQVTQPQELFPFLKDTFTSASGKIALDGTIQWGDRLVSNVQMLAEELNLEAMGMKLNRINTVLQLNKIWPPSTPPGQEVSIALMNVGLPLTNGIFTFHLKPTGLLFLNRGEWQVAGGKLFVRNVSIDPNRMEHKINIEVRDVDLQALSELSKVEGLTATGRLGGQIPVQIQTQKKRIVIEEGLLQATPEGGRIRYNPRVVPPVFQYGGERTQLVLSALKDFRYKTLQLHLNGPSDGEAKIRTHLRGSNPDFFNNRAVEFNLNLSGPLGQIIQASTEGYRIPESIQKKLDKFGR